MAGWLRDGKDDVVVRGVQASEVQNGARGASGMSCLVRNPVSLTVFFHWSMVTFPR
jgi:hypothetical protein